MDWPNLITPVLTFLLGLITPYIRTRLRRKQELREVDKQRLRDVRQAAYELWDEAVKAPLQKRFLPVLPAEIAKKVNAAVIELDDRRLSRYWKQFESYAVPLKYKWTKDFVNDDDAKPSTWTVIWAEWRFKKLVRRLNDLERNR